MSGVGDLVVVKLGGSLLRARVTSVHLRRWLSAREEKGLVLVVGGGAAVNHLRNWSARHRLPQTTAHWWCIDCMAQNARTVHSWLADFEFVDDWTAIRKAGQGRWILDVRPWLWSDRTMPRSWSVTSDSIAVALGGALGASRVALLKSCLPELKTDSVRWDQLAKVGFVDDFFPHAARRSGVPSIELVDLYRGRSREVNRHFDSRGQIGAIWGREHGKDVLPERSSVVESARIAEDIARRVD